MFFLVHDISERGSGLSMPCFQFDEVAVVVML